MEGLENSLQNEQQFNYPQEQEYDEPQEVSLD